MTAEAYRCAAASQERLEPIHGTASNVKRWLLLEQPGSWGRDALLDSDLPDEVARALRRNARAAGVRVILIRKGVRSVSEGRRVFFIRTEEDQPYMAEAELDEAAEILDFDLSPLREGGPVEGATPRATSLFLICTHGRHDACCSIRGNQVSRVACAAEGFDAWECSHIGGDRFAANVVCFPHGIYYGRVDAAEVKDLMRAYGDGRLSLPHLRGRCSQSFSLQAAEYYARRETGTTAIDGLRLAEALLQEGSLAATFDLEDGRKVAVEIAVGESTEPHRLTCGSTLPELIPTYALRSTSITPASEG